MSTYTVTAKRWARGWELDIEGVGTTQSHTLADAEAMIRDYLALDLGEAAADGATIEIRPVIDGLENEAAELRRQVAQLEADQQAVARRSRALAGALKTRGLTGKDTAAVLGVSPQRVSQLLRRDATGRFVAASGTAPSRRSKTTTIRPEAAPDAG